MWLRWVITLICIIEIAADNKSKINGGKIKSSVSEDSGKTKHGSVSTGLSDSGKANRLEELNDENKTPNTDSSSDSEQDADKQDKKTTEELNKELATALAEKERKKEEAAGAAADSSSDPPGAGNAAQKPDSSENENPSSAEDANPAGTVGDEPDADDITEDSPEGAEAKAETANIMSRFKTALSAKSDEWKKNDPDGAMQQGLKDQNAANKERLQETADKALNAANAMQGKMQQKRDEFGQVIEQEANKYKEETEKLLGSLTTGIEGMEIDMEPGKGIVNGDFIEMSGFELAMGADAGKECVANCDGASGGGDDTVSSSDDMIDLMIGECYKGIKEGNKELVDKNCATADIATYRCRTPIDASFYIGVSFDITKSNDPSGFRSKLIKHWCRERNTYKGQYDVPDGMHIQGVYETSVSTEVFTSDIAATQAEAKLATSLSGEAIFSEDKEDATSSSSTSMGVTGGASGSNGQGASGGANAQSGSTSGKSAGSFSFSNNKKNSKIGAIENNKSNKKTTGDEMVATMKVNVIRYEMFLREVSPKFIHEDFLDCFMMLPNSFYAPKAPEKFMDFITRYGTHYLKAAKFGGQLTIVKKKRKIQGMTITDMRSEAQEEMDTIVGVGSNKHRSTGPNTSGTSIGGTVDIGIASGTAKDADTRTTSVDSSSQKQNGVAITDLEQEAKDEIKRERFRKSSTTTRIKAVGGTHKIATTITDLYSTNFRTNLVRWLDSIPRYPKPFEPVFEEVSELMIHLIDDMIDQTCYSSCIIEKEENCLKERTHTIACDTVFASNSPDCLAQCIDNVQECNLSAPRIIACYEIVEQKARMKRKVDALRTAIGLYVNEGSLYSPTHYTIPAQPEGCTTSYRAIDPDDEFDFEFGESEEQNWDTISQGFIELQLNMKQNYFNGAGLLEIEKNAKLYIIFDESDRRWYTLDEILQPRRSEFASPPVSFNEIKRIETANSGVYASIPVTIPDGDEQFVTFRLRHGLWLDINLKNGDVLFTSRSLDAMQKSQNQEVIEFLAAYETSVLTQMAAGSGQSLGFINPIVQNTGLAPFPCDAQWSDSQMFDSSDDVQQCIKITLETTEEYFFIVANSIEDKSSWIYVHQTLDTLCLHKLDKTLQKNEFTECASKYGKMATGTIPNMVEQLYFCVYQKGDLVSISLSRPSLNRQDKESAITILTHNLIQNSDGSGKIIMPRYYAVGGGASAVFVRSTFMVEIESLECRKPFIKKTFGGSFKCVLDCHEQCSDYGCMSQLDSTKCYTCLGNKMIINREGEDQIINCVQSCSNVERTYQLGGRTIVTSIKIVEDVDLKDRDSQKVCVACHELCDRDCDGITEWDCTGPPNGGRKCKYKEQTFTDANSLETRKCLTDCPVGTYTFTDDKQIDFCYNCTAECLLCDDDRKQSFAMEDDSIVEFQRCLKCADDHLEVVIDIDYYACIPITNVLGCPKGYQRHGTQCHKSWRPIGFQNIATGAALTANCRSIGCEIDVDGNFLNLGTQTTFQNRFSSEELDADGNLREWFNFQLAWKVDACTVVVLEWRQDNNPLDTSAVVTDKSVEIFGFKQIKCVVNDPNLANLKKISFANANFFTHCPDIQTTKYNSSSTGFTGLRLDSTSEDYILKGSSIDLYNFGYIKLPDTGVVSAFKIEKSIFFTTEMQLSVHDEREPPIGWSAWDPKLGEVDQCQITDCTTGEKQIKRTRFCRCVVTGGTVEINDRDDTVAFNSGCQPCIGESEVIETCEMSSSCQDTSGLEIANTPSIQYYHHSCCEGSTALRVMGLNQDGNKHGYNGIYELEYQENEEGQNYPKHKYKLLGDCNYAIEKQNDGTWKIYDEGGTPANSAICSALVETHISGLSVSGDPATIISSSCPVNAGGWSKIPVASSGTEIDVSAGTYIYRGSSHLSVTCSTGRNTCPSLYPYSFDRGTKCCSSPFFSDSNTYRLLRPGDTTSTAKGKEPYGSGGSTELEDNTGCVGTWEDCPIYVTRGGLDTASTATADRCRTNLRNTDYFKATKSKNYAYQFKLCPKLCYEVFAESVPSV